MRSRCAAVVAIAAAAVVSVAGCGLSARPGGSQISVTVGRDFGSRIVTPVRRTALDGSKTAAAATRAAGLPVRTAGRGGPVEAIGGIPARPNRQTWFGYVNGIAAGEGPTAVAVHPGDRLWWDLHDSTASVTAVVGAYPEPFVHGVGGKRFPVVLECAASVGDACHQVGLGLQAIGIPVAVQQPGTGSGTDSLTVVVGTWRDLQAEIVGALLARGPGSSGVYARFSSSGSRLELLTPAGAVARTLGARSGLIAAIAHAATAPTWLVTGTDPAGVRSAADALTANRLHNRFALAVSAGGDVPLPVTSR